MFCHRRRRPRGASEESGFGDGGGVGDSGDDRRGSDDDERDDWSGTESTETGTVDPAESFQVEFEGPAGERRSLFGAEDIDRVGTVQERNGQHQLPLTLTGEGARTARERLRASGALDRPGEATFLISVDDEVVQELSLSRELATAIESGEWQGEFLLVFAEREPAERVRAHLSGAGDDR